MESVKSSLRSLGDRYTNSGMTDESRARFDERKLSRHLRVNGIYRCESYVVATRLLDELVEETRSRMTAEDNDAFANYVACTRIDLMRCFENDAREMIPLLEEATKGGFRSNVVESRVVVSVARAATKQERTELARGLLIRARALVEKCSTREEKYRFHEIEDFLEEIESGEPVVFASADYRALLPNEWEFSWRHSCLVSMEEFMTVPELRVETLELCNLVQGFPHEVEFVRTARSTLAMTLAVRDEAIEIVNEALDELRAIGWNDINGEATTLLIYARYLERQGLFEQVEPLLRELQIRMQKAVEDGELSKRAARQTLRTIDGLLVDGAQPSRPQVGETLRDERALGRFARDHATHLNDFEGVATIVVDADKNGWTGPFEEAHTKLAFGRYSLRHQRSEPALSILRALLPRLAEPDAETRIPYYAQEIAQRLLRDLNAL
jgi:hypothetical protein